MSIENNLQKKDGEAEKIREQERINDLWKKFHLVGNPPKVGTPVMDRLFNACQSYINFLAKSKINMMTDSEATRKDLHNQIALMVDGRVRTSMSPKRSEEISNFASFLVYKVGIEDLEKIMDYSETY